jgi:transcriptional regulator with XRE-family HTH domain
MGMNWKEVVRLLEQKRDGRYWKVLAAEIGISESLLSRIRKGRAMPGAKVLAYLGLEKQKIYIPAENSQ